MCVYELFDRWRFLHESDLPHRARCLFSELLCSPKKVVISGMRMLLRLIPNKLSKLCGSIRFKYSRATINEVHSKYKVGDAIQVKVNKVFLFATKISKWMVQSSLIGCNAMQSLLLLLSPSRGGFITFGKRANTISSIWEMVQPTSAYKFLSRWKYKKRILASDSVHRLVYLVSLERHPVAISTCAPKTSN